MRTGQISVQSENIFPIIKKFLYTDQEIFLRELVSNAVDATKKLSTLSRVGEFEDPIDNCKVEISFDEKAKTLTISDSGIGMTEDEVEKYITQLAFSGAREFAEQWKDKDPDQMIGHFGLGFYSAFMVSKSVTIETKSYQKGAQAVHWDCDGATSYNIGKGKRKKRGTDVILHLTDEDAETYLSKWKLRELLRKYCRFLPIPITFDGEDINNTQPIWTKKPAELEAEDYKKFFEELYPAQEAPLFNIHINTDYPFNLTGVLYFPKVNEAIDNRQNRVQLYCNQVFVTDEVKDIVPEFLMLLHGVIDSPDIPLNVSRSYLQGDPNVKKINAHITKKVADKLEEIFNSDRKAFEDKWESLGLFVKYGMITDDKFLDKANKFLILEDAAAAGTFYTLDEYKKATESNQKNKDGKQVLLYTTNPVGQDAFIQAAVGKGYKVIKLETMVDAAFINNVEMKWEGVQFVRVDADVVDNLIDKQENVDSVLSKDEVEQAKKLFEFQIPETTITVEVKGLSQDAAPVIATRPEFMRRMKDMASMGGGGMTAFYAQMPDEVHLTINGNHAIFQALLNEPDVEKQQKQARNLADLALLSQGLLKGAELTNFINRSVDLLK